MNMGTIYYWSPDYTSAVGGVKILYRHVDILNRNGFSAAVIHRKSGFRCTWFDNDTRISYLKKTILGDNDYLVIPEVYGSVYTNPSSRPKAYKTFRKLFETPAKKIIFNQNTYNTFKGYSLVETASRSMYRDDTIVGVMVVSDDNKEYLGHAFPGLDAYRIHNSINQEVFSYSPQKKKQVCFMPRKNSDHAMQVAAMLKFRRVLDDFKIVPIQDMSEHQTAEILRESLIFMSFGYPEGFSLPPAEAMACGCIVIGYHGMGGREYFTPETGFPIEMGDIITFARTVEKVIEDYRNDPGPLMERAHRASALIQDTYTTQREERDVLDFWNSIFI